MVPPLGDTSPLFCIHPDGGSAHWYQQLSGFLPEWLPVAGFQHPGLIDLAEAGRPTEQLARRYADEFVAAQPAGPYHLFSWCGGAPIAWEMAVSLRTTGANVSLILLDPILQTPEEHGDGGENLRFLTECDEAYTRLAHETSPERIADLRARVAKLLPLIVAEHHHNLLGSTGLDEVWPAAVRSWRLQMEARLPYRYRTYDGVLHLLACDEVAGGVHEGLAGLSFERYVERWRGLAPAGVHVHRVAGGNITSMLPPHVTGLAGRIAAVLRRSS